MGHRKIWNILCALEMCRIDKYLIYIHKPSIPSLFNRHIMKSWLEASGMDDGSLSCMLVEPREALLPITGRENLAPRKRYKK